MQAVKEIDLARRQQVNKQSDPTHHHHWIIEQANGPVSTGECKYCHAHRDFSNWLAETDFLPEERRVSVA